MSIPVLLSIFLSAGSAACFWSAGRNYEASRVMASTSKIRSGIRQDILAGIAALVGVHLLYLIF